VTSPALPPDGAGDQDLSEYFGELPESREERLEEIRRGLGVLLNGHRVVELRGCGPNGRAHSQVFRGREGLAEAAFDLDAEPAIAGVYVTLNPIGEGPAQEHRAARDADVERRVRLPLDFDPVRPAKTSASDVEHLLALERAEACAAFLAGEGWPEPIRLDSGNGAHVLYSIDLPNDAPAAQLVSEVLEALAFRFGDDLVELDRKVGNASRIWKLPGTTARKGTSTAERPHRRARILAAPEHHQVVTVEQLQAIAALRPAPAPRAPSPAVPGHRFDVEAFVGRHLEVRRGPMDWNGGRKWILSRCPWNPEHTDRSAYVLEFPSGAIAAGCRHASCASWGWRELRERFEPKERRRESRPWAEGVQGAREAGAFGGGPQASAEEHVQEGAQPSTWPTTDAGNGERFVAACGADVRYDHQRQRWLLWTGSHWAEDQVGEAMQLAIRTARQIPAEALRCPDALEYERLLKWALRSEGLAKLRAMLETASTAPAVRVTPADLDADLWALNVENGTLDLRTGELRPHHREDLLTHRVPVAFELGRRRDRWEAFLLEIFDGDADLALFVQRAVGYTLTGHTSEQCFFLLYGTGANGKSTFVETIALLLGQLCRATPFEALLQQDRPQASGHSEDLARLAGCRMATAVEADAGRRLSEAKVKQLTGGDTVSASFKYSHAFEFRPAFKLWLACNHRPVIRGADDGIWRRVRLIPFRVRFEGERRDDRLKETLARELPGILAWAVEGAQEWARHGLGDARAVREATAGYRSEMDTLGQFLEECCVVAPAAQVRAGSLYAAYRSWAERNGQEPLSQRGLAMRLQDRPEGMEPVKLTSGDRAWRGIGLVEGNAWNA